MLVLSRHIASRHDLPGLAVCHAEDIHALSGCMSLRAVQTTDSLLAACVTVWRGMDSDCATDSDYRRNHSMGISSRMNRAVLSGHRVSNLLLSIIENLHRLTASHMQQP